MEICTYESACRKCCDEREEDGFCWLSSACSGFSYCNEEPLLRRARRFAQERGLRPYSYDVFSGKCGHVWIVPKDPA